MSHRPVRSAFLAGIAAGLVIAGGIVAFAATSGGDEVTPKPIALPAQSVAAPATTTVAKKPKPRKRPERRDLPQDIADDYAMFSAAGDRALEEIIDDVAAMLVTGASREEVMAMVSRRLGEVAERHEEASDTAVVEAFADELDRFLVAAGFEPVEAYDEFAF